MMKQMMELAKLNENHKLLASMAGTWTYNVTMWMAPGAPPSKSTGTAVRKAMMDGRYFSLRGHRQNEDARGRRQDEGHAIQGHGD